MADITSKKNPFYKSLLESINKGVKKTAITGAAGSFPASLIANLKRDTDGPFLILTPLPEEAERVAEDISFFLPGSVHLFPSWETLPFDRVSPSLETMGDRVSAIYALMTGSPIIVAPVSALIQKAPPRDFLNSSMDYLEAGEETELESLVEKLSNGGYSRVGMVHEVGEWSRRGGIIDIFPPSTENPVRVEFVGDLVESIREFEPASQRSVKNLNSVIILPVGSSPMLRQAQHERENNVRPELVEGLIHSGVTLFNYLPKSAPVFLLEPAGIEDELKRIEKETEERRAGLEEEDGGLQGSPLRADELLSILNGYPNVDMSRLAVGAVGETPLHFDVKGNEDIRLGLTKKDGAFDRFVELSRGWLREGMRVVIASHTPGQTERVEELLKGKDMGARRVWSYDIFSLQDTPGLFTATGMLNHGFRVPSERLVIVTEEEIFGRRVRLRQVKAKTSAFITSLSDLKVNDPIVHIDHGIGIHRGLQKLNIGGVDGDFLLIEYAGKDKLYLPVYRMDQVQKYTGGEGPTLDKLGGTSWDKLKKRVKEKIKEMAAELLDIYAARKVMEGFAYSPPDHYFDEFEAAFEYEETPDQMEAIKDVLCDMTEPKPMDRLVCGDVGYGKTEVAIRAAFKAVLDGKQVAVLVPTTVLASQHLQTFHGRMSSFPVKIEMLSRFKSPKEQKEIVKKLREGGIDIVIGTHKLLQKEIVFKDLGLIVVDEEQRFGVSHKEKLKKLMKQVDVLTLTATPIPRTLHMSLMGIRDLSVINTPPEDRLAIKTFVSKFSDDIIKEAVERELRRGGQVFFVHNRVESIGTMADHLHALIPEARIVVGHGQMDEHELEKVMLSFMNGEKNILLCTTIIESGLDIPAANTIIINRADTFGLSQLYQLRGRVGRSKHRAYAYLLVPAEETITVDARKRLEIIQELTELGSGFKIAAHDLEIRGAGNLLGGEQSGQIEAVGFDLYTQLLEEAVAELKGEENIPDVEPNINLCVAAYIPDDYMDDVNERLVIYKRLASVREDGDVAEIADELRDRYGPLPQLVENLLTLMEIKRVIRKALVTSIDAARGRVSITFDPRTPVRPEKVIELIKEKKDRIKFTPGSQLIIFLKDETLEGIYKEVRETLERLV
ncbi:MAG: transcription-repair coupling factor [Deltaproteobacteria bacterium]|nr:transcription-repair coupling factor [Deltaproteobacteria bacterium]